MLQPSEGPENFVRRGFLLFGIVFGLPLIIRIMPSFRQLFIKLLVKLSAQLSAGSGTGKNAPLRLGNWITMPINAFIPYEQRRAQDAFFSDSARS